MTIKTDNTVIGVSATDTNNFLLDTDLAGALRLRRKTDGSGGTILTVDSNGLINQTKQLTLGTAVATTSGTAVTLSGIPSWVKRITLMLAEVSTSGTGNLAIRLGTAAGNVSSGYKGGTSIASAAAATNDTSLVLVSYSASAATKSNGTVTLIHMGGNLWAISGVVGRSTSGFLDLTGYTVQLPGVLDRLVVLTGNGTDTFDGGSVNILYEG